MGGEWVGFARTWPRAWKTAAYIESLLVADTHRAGIFPAAFVITKMPPTDHHHPKLNAGRVVARIRPISRRDRKRGPSTVKKSTEVGSLDIAESHRWRQDTPFPIARRTHNSTHRRSRADEHLRAARRGIVGRSGGCRIMARLADSARAYCAEWKKSACVFSERREGGVAVSWRAGRWAAGGRPDACNYGGAFRQRGGPLAATRDIGSRTRPAPACFGIAHLAVGNRPTEEGAWHGRRPGRRLAPFTIRMPGGRAVSQKRETR